MAHLDDGRLTAWLDGALSPESPGGEVVARHLSACADCRSRLEEERSLRTRSGEILAAADLAPSSAPEFAEIVARARAGRTGQTGPGRPRGRGSRGSRPASPGMGLAWAASLALAVGAGWIARDLSRERGVPLPPAMRPPAAELEERAVPEPGAAAADRLGAPRAAAGRAAAEAELREETAPARRDASKAGHDADADPVAAEDVSVRTERAAAPLTRLATGVASDAFHAPPDAAGLAVAAVAGHAAVGCWSRPAGTGVAALLPAIRLTDERAPTAKAGGAEATVLGFRVVATGGAAGAVARWAPFGPDSVWIGAEGNGTMRLRVSGDRLDGRMLLREPTRGEAVEGAAPRGAEAPEPASVAWRRVPCGP
ncbi:MAG: hypothetical protein R6X22_10545 [Gemmatimonadota bacterium]